MPLSSPLRSRGTARRAPIIPAEQAVFLLDLQLGTMRNTKKIPPGRVEVIRSKPTDPRTNPNAISSSKKLLDCDELRAIKTLHHQLRDYVQMYALPQEQFRGGIYMLPLSRFEFVEAYLQQTEVDLRYLVEELITNYDLRIRESQTALGLLFNRGDYPTPNDLRARLIIKYSYQTLSTPEGLKNYSQEIFEREQAKLREKMAEAVEDCRKAIAASTKDLLLEISDRMTLSEDGQPKIIRPSMIEKWLETFDLLGSKNITNDTELQAALESARATLQGKTEESLLHNATVQEATLSTFSGLIANLDRDVINRPSRQMNLDDK